MACQLDVLGKDNFINIIESNTMIIDFSSGSVDFNSIALASLSKLLSGNMQVKRISSRDYTPGLDDMVTMCTLAHFNNGVVTPVVVVTTGYSAKVTVGGIYFGYNFKKYSEEFFTEYGLDAKAYGIKRVCSEFNDESCAIDNMVTVKTEVNPNISDTATITLAEFVNTFTGVIDLRFSFKFLKGSGELTDDTRMSIISSHDAVTLKDESIYLMPCTVEFNNNVKTIGYFMVNISVGVAIPFIFLGEEFDADKESDQQAIRTIRPLIVSPVSDGGVIVSEGMELKLITQNEFKILLQEYNN